jgi:hypothetical protein
MAKRKAVRGSSRKTAKGRPSGRTRAAAKKTAASRKGARKAATKKAARKATASARPSAKAALKKAKPPASRRSSAKKAAPPKKAALPKKAAPPRKAVPKKATLTAKAKRAVKTSGPKRSAVTKPAPISAAPPAKRVSKSAARIPARSAPGLNRERRTIADDERIPSPPSSLDLDRTASAARSGRRAQLDKYEEHTETSPALTAGDVDADWESAYSVGDEAPGGDNPTPDQDIVDDIGRAVGVQYQDNEELKGEKKLLERDKHRWELDPASSDDWEDR